MGLGRITLVTGVTIMTPGDVGSLYFFGHFLEVLGGMDRWVRLLNYRNWFVAATVCHPTMITRYRVERG